MFYTLLAATFILAFAVSVVTARLFAKPADAILSRIIQDPISTAWTKYLKFALYVVGISSGVRLHNLESYIKPLRYVKDSEPIKLTAERWTLEIYRTIIETLQGLAWVLLVFFIIALIAFVLVRIIEIVRKNKTTAGKSDN